MSTSLISDDAERSVLGAILINNDLLDEVIDVLAPRHFGREHHAQLFTAMLALDAGGKKIDYTTLRSQLQDMQLLDNAMTAYYIKLGDGVPRSTNISYYAGIVLDRSLKRDIREFAKRAAVEAETGERSGVGLLEQLESELYAMGHHAVRSDWTAPDALARETWAHVEDLHERKSLTTGVDTGFVDLDYALRGLQPSDLILLGARPSQGKTAFASQVALRIAESRTVGFFSIEMSRQGIGLRNLIQLSGVHADKVFTGRASDVEQRALHDGFVRMGESHFWLDESPFLSPAQVRSKLRRLKMKAGRLDLVVIDYLQLMAPMPDDKRENRTNQVAGVSRMLKLLAREFGVPFLVLSQLHRVPDNRRPTMADLRDSGALEQDADVVLLLHRPEVYEPTEQNRGVAEVIIGKHRNGAPGTHELTWRGDVMRFENRAYQ